VGGGGASVGGDDVVGWGGVLLRARTAAALLSAGSTAVEAGTVAAAGAVTCILTRALATWSTTSSGTADASAWSASMLLRMGERESLEGGHLAFSAHENVATLAFFSNEERSERRD
jgi:hypothetical protein